MYIDRNDLQAGDVIYLRQGFYAVKCVRTVVDARGFTMEVEFLPNTQNATEGFRQRFDPTREPFLAGGK